MQQSKLDQKINLKYVFMARKSFIFRLRIWLAHKILPGRMGQGARAWFAGIEVVVQQKERPNRVQRRKR
jgi:hypothetical protein